MAQQVVLSQTGDRQRLSARRPSAVRFSTALPEFDPGADDAVALLPDRGIELVEGRILAPFDLSAAGFRSLSPLVGAGKVVYRGVRDDHHVFEHVSGAFYEPVSRLRPPGPRGFLSRSTLQLDCGALIAEFTDAGHVWVSSQPGGLAVQGSTVSFSFHFHQAADGRWVASAWDPVHVRICGGLLAMAPLASLRAITEVILPAIAAGLANRAAPPSGSVNRGARPSDDRAGRTSNGAQVALAAREGRTVARPKGPFVSLSAVRSLVCVRGGVALVAVIALAMIGIGKGTLQSSAVPGDPSTPLSVSDAGSGPGVIAVSRSAQGPLDGPGAQHAVDVAPAVPALSGAGRRIVYCNTCQRVWLVEADESVTRSYRVSGRQGVPSPGTYSVQSKSTAAGTASGMRLDHMVRFAMGRREWIGFHAIPIGESGPIQSIDELGQPLSQGCIRQDPDDARALWEFAPVRTSVIVVA
jgi:hypothetical protein